MRGKSRDAGIRDTGSRFGRARQGACPALTKKTDRSKLSVVRKGDKTRDRIVRQTGGLFNRFGYRSTPMSAVMKATGLQKGGLYGHFHSKKDLAIDTFRFNVSTLAGYLQSATAGANDTVTELRRFLAASIGVAEDRAVPGGCPVLNAAVESDDSFPALRKEAVLGAEGLRRAILRLLTRARAEGLIRRDVDIQSQSWFFLAAMEGGIMLSKLRGSSRPLEAVLRELNAALDAFIAEPK
jgi:TetR/AcrR family transcriptional regulator, transcriptional repressor for nem operon